MLRPAPFIPQQADSIKKFLFDSGQGNTELKEIPAQEKTDTSTAKKTKREKKRKENSNDKAGAKKQAEITEIPETTAAIKQSDTLSAIHSLAPRQPAESSKNTVTSTHQPKTGQLPDKIHLQNREYWIPSIILFSLLIIVWARNSHNNRFTRIGKAFFNIREFYQVVREEYAMINSLSIAMLVLFVSTLSVFIYQLNSYYKIFALNPTAFIFFLKIIVFVFLFFLAKLLLINILGILFYGRTEQVSDFIYNIILMNNISGLTLVPVIIFMSYFDAVSKPLLILISCILLGIIYLYRILRTFNLSIGEGKVSKFYFFAYLCTLEFLPFVVILKVITSRF